MLYDAIKNALTANRSVISGMIYSKICLIMRIFSQWYTKDMTVDNKLCPAHKNLCRLDVFDSSLECNIVLDKVEYYYDMLQCNTM